MFGGWQVGPFQPLPAFQQVAANRGHNRRRWRGRIYETSASATVSFISVIEQTPAPKAPVRPLGHGAMFDIPVPKAEQTILDLEAIRLRAQAEVEQAQRADVAERRKRRIEKAVGLYADSERKTLLQLRDSIAQLAALRSKRKLGRRH